MGLLLPWMLVGLLSLPVLVALYLLRLKRPPQRVPSTLLWQRVINDHQANAPFQRLRRNLLLLVQLLIALLVVLAAARPYRLAPGLGGARTVVILDASASMQATDVRPNRFEVARSEVRQLIDALAPGETMALVVLGARARLACSWTGDRETLRNALRQTSCEETQGSLLEAVRLASALAEGKPTTAVFVTDAAFAADAELTLGNLEPRLIRVGRRASNVGVTALSSRPDLQRGGRPVLYCELTNASKLQREVTLEFYQEERLIDARTVTLKGGTSKPLIVDDLPLTSGLLRAHIHEADDLSVDDDAYVSLGADRPLRVLLITRGNLFLAQALAVEPNTVVSQIRPADFSPTFAFDVGVVDNCRVDPLPPGNYLFLGGVGSDDNPVVLGAEVESPTVLKVAGAHPLNRQVQWTRVGFGRAFPGRARPQSVVLVEAEGGVLAAAREAASARSVGLAFRVEDTEFPLRPDFPILIANILHWLSSSRLDREARVVTTGRSAAVEGAVQFESPNGEQVKLTQAGRTGVAILNRVGVYRARWPDHEETIAASLLSKAESELAPAEALHFAHTEARHRQGAALVKRILTPWFALAALGFLAVEWWLYHRRP